MRSRRSRLVAGTLGVALAVAILTYEVLVRRLALTLERYGVGDAALMNELRGLLLAAVIVGLVSAVSASLLQATLLARRLRRLAGKARAVVPGAGRRSNSGDELEGLAGSLKVVAAELQAANSSLADERHRAQAILGAMREAVIALDPQQRVTSVNDTARELLGIGGEVGGRTLRETVRVPALYELLARGAAEDEFELGAANPRRVWARTTPLPDGLGCVVVMRDVTELRRLETMRRDFVANVSHELRTPVSIIRANAETLLDGALADPEGAKGFLEALHRNAERLSQLVADLLDLSRLEAGGYALERRPLNLHTALEHTVQTFAARAADKRQSVRARSMSGKLWVVADSGALTQILTNLVENAVKYTPLGGHVELFAEPRGGVVRIGVADDGFGIEPRHKGRIFERFYRVDPGRSRDMGGTGLGLAIVKNLTEAMNGAVGVEDNVPRGSVFWVDLPMASGAGES